MKRTFRTVRPLGSRVVGLLLTLVLGACGGIGDGNTLAVLAITDASFVRPAGTTFEAFQCFPGQLRVLGTFDDGSQDVTLSNRATWSSSNPSIVQVSDGSLTLTTGEQLAKGALVPSADPAAIGQTATITAKFVDLSASIEVVLRPGTLEVSPTQVTIASGTTLQMYATAILGEGTTDSPGRNQAISFNDGVIWESTDTAVATVDEAGVVTGVVGGQPPSLTTIRAKTGVDCPTILNAETQVSVTNAALQSISLHPTALFNLADFGRNTSGLLRLIGNYAGNFAQDLAGQATLASSAQATISANGTLVSAVADSGMVTLSTQDQNGNSVNTIPAGPDNAKINGSKHLIANGLSSEPAAATMLVGTEMDFNAIGDFTDPNNGNQASQQNLYRNVTWVSSDSSVATVGVFSGRVTALTEGTTTITATRADIVLDQNFEDTTTITVLPFTGASLTQPPALTVNCPEPVLSGTVADCSATVALNGGSQDVSLFVIWGSSNPAAAAVSNAPVVRNAPGLIFRENELGRPILPSTPTAKSMRIPLPGRVFGAGTGQTVITATLFDADGVQLATGSDGIDNSLPPPPPPNDADNDGVVDAQDQCPGTPPASPVNAVGCPDSDDDTVFDNEDVCPNEDARPDPSSSPARNGCLCDFSLPILGCQD